MPSITPSHIFISPALRIPLSELNFRTSRSGGPGGQNVNKLETRVELLFDILHSTLLSETLRQRLLKNLAPHIDSSGMLSVTVQESRSQWQNKQIAIERFAQLIESGLYVPKKRKPTRPSKSAREKRLQQKKRHGERKRLRSSGSDAL
jgi:ribosome-associated protein